MAAIMKIVRTLFYIFLTAFLVGGVAIVSLQALGVLFLSNALVTGATEAIAPYAFWACTLCAVCAFILTYQNEDKH